MIREVAATPATQRIVGTCATGMMLAFGGVAYACQICLPMPTESVADRILASEHLVLTREHPTRPYEHQLVRVLEGDPSLVPPVDVFLDSGTRRRLARDPQLALLSGWSAENKEWRQLLLHGDTVAPVVAGVLAAAESWERDPDRRYRYFANFLGHEDTRLSDLAHLEVAKAPYSKLVKFADRIPRDHLYEALGNMRRMEWHALYILFLGQSEDPRDRQHIRNELARCAEYKLVTRTAAWATALVEIDGLDGVERLSELYLRNPGRRAEELAAIHAALRVHADEGPPELRERVVVAYGSLLERNPSLAPDLAADLTRWQRFDHAATFADLVKKDSLDLTATTRIRQHLRAAQVTTDSRDTPGSESVPSNRGLSFPLVLMLLLLLIALATPFARRRLGPATAK